MTKKLKFRPHHFLCAIGFEGKGYSDLFNKNFADIVSALRGENGGDIPIEVVMETDSICAPCPHKRHKLCVEQHKIQQLDNAHANALGLQDGDVLSWQNAQQRIVKNISLTIFDKICAPCEWKKLGICATALKKLR